MNQQDGGKLGLYTLVSDSATALIESIIRVNRTNGQELQTAVKRRLQQIEELIWEHIRDEAHELDDMASTILSSEDHSPRILWQPPHLLQPQADPLELSEPLTPVRLRDLPPPAAHENLIEEEERPARRFPMTAQLLEILGEQPNDDVFAQAAREFVNYPNYQERLQLEMTDLNGMLERSDPSLHIGERTIMEQLNRMEMTMEQILGRVNDIAMYQAN